MSDRRLRDLERRWKETGSKEDRVAYERMRLRQGMGRLQIRHYIDDEFHGHLDHSGNFALTEAQAKKRSIVIRARCNVELWPRETGHGYFRRTMRKNVFYTEDPDDVTCKTCLASLNKPDERVYYRTHYAPGSKNGRERGITPVAVCDGVDSERYVVTYSHTMRAVNCPRCRRIMKGGQRSPRRPKMRVPGPLDALPGGNFPIEETA